MRPVLCSSDDVTRTIEEGCRARFIAQLVAAPEDYLTREFASSFHSAAHGTEPACLLTSHATHAAHAAHGRPSDLQPNRKVAVPAYPSLVQSLRWNPNIETSSANNSRTNIVENRQSFTCKCENCGVRTCPSKMFKDTNVQRGVFKDNVMRFSDGCTMTPRLTDACCGGHSAPAGACIAVRDTETETHIPYGFPPKYAPIPILKRAEYSQPACPYGCCHVPAGLRRDAAVRDTDASEDCCEPIKPKPPKSFIKFKRKPSKISKFCDSERKILYNEGISDEIAQHIEPARVLSPIDVSRGCSRVSVRSRCFVDDDGIPYSHRGESRYHHSCKKSTLRPYNCTSDSEEVRHTVASPRTATKTIGATTKLPARQFKLPRSPLPRKVLASELDIDAYMEQSPPAPPARRRKAKWLF